MVVPNEMLYQIALRSDINGLLKLRLTSRYFRNIILNDAIFQKEWLSSGGRDEIEIQILKIAIYECKTADTLISFINILLGNKIIDFEFLLKILNNEQKDSPNNYKIRRNLNLLKYIIDYYKPKNSNILSLKTYSDCTNIFHDNIELPRILTPPWTPPPVPQALARCLRPEENE